MPDDLSKLTPNDPSNLDPAWNEKRKSMLDGVLADRSRHRRHIGGWIAGVAAAAVVAIAVSGVAQQLRPEPYATPAPPTPSPGVEQTDLVAARSVLLFTGDDAKLCRGGAVEYSRPPQCEGIPVDGVSPEDVPLTERAGGVAWTPEVIVTGMFDGTTLTVTDVYEGDDPNAPQPVPWRANDDREPFGDLCGDPVTGKGPGDRPLEKVEQELPGYQGTWGSDPHNVAVTGDVEAAEGTLSQYVQGDFCVGTVPGGSAADGYAAEKSVSKVPDVEWATYNADVRGAWLLVMLLTDDEKAKAEIETLVGPEQWAYTAVASFFYPVERTDAPAPSDSPVPIERLVAARDTLIDTGNGMTLCNGSVLESRPPGCPFPTPVTGITWDDVPWAETADGITFDRTPGSITFADAIIVGTFEGDAFVATQVFRDDDPAAPQPPDTIVDEELPTLCDAPTRGTGPDSVEDLIVTAENLPGYQALWVSPNQVTYNVAVTSDVASARSALTEVFGGELCVGTVDGPTDQGLQDAELALEPLKPDVHDPTATDSIWNTFSSISTRGNRVEVSVRRDTTAILDQIEAAVGPEVWPHTDVIPFFYPVGSS